MVSVLKPQSLLSLSAHSSDKLYASGIWNSVEGGQEEGHAFCTGCPYLMSALLLPPFQPRLAWPDVTSIRPSPSKHNPQPVLKPNPLTE